MTPPASFPPAPAAAKSTNPSQGAALQRRAPCTVCPAWIAAMFGWKRCRLFRSGCGQDACTDRGGGVPHECRALCPRQDTPPHGSAAAPRRCGDIQLAECALAFQHTKVLLTAAHEFLLGRGVDFPTSLPRNEVSEVLACAALEVAPEVVVGESTGSTQDLTV